MRGAPKLALLWLLYLIQGLPFGYQHTVVPLLVQERGASLTWVGLSSGLALPWLLKPLWAPLIDRYGSRRFGRRRSWIVAMQLLLLLSVVGAALLLPEETSASLAPLLLMVALMNLAAATMDIAVDGLAVDLLSRRELGQGNVAQVVGYKLGMLAGGGLLVWAARYITDRGTLLSMAAIIALGVQVMLLVREPVAVERTAVTEDLGALLGVLWRALRRPTARRLLLVVATYKMGESLADGMFKPWLLSEGISKADIGLWVGSWGMGASLLGSLAGGTLASRIGIERALWWTALARAIPLLAQLWIVQQGLSTPSAVIAVTCAEHFFGGALTTAMFATMMAGVDRRVGGSHFTLIAAVEVLGKTPAFWGSGMIADAFGFTPVFVLAVVLSLAFLPLLRWARPLLPERTAELAAEEAGDAAT